MSVEASPATKPSLTFKRHFNASPEKLYVAWTDPEALLTWFGPPGFEVLRTQGDARVGGDYRIVMRSTDGQEHDLSGVYREVVPNEKLVFTWAWRSTPERESLVTLLIKPDGDGSLLTLTHEQFFDEATRDDHRQGWQGCFDSLDRYLA